MLNHNQNESIILNFKTLFVVRPVLPTVNWPDWMFNQSERQSKSIKYEVRFNLTNQISGLPSIIWSRASRQIVYPIFNFPSHKVLDLVIIIFT